MEHEETNHLEICHAFAHDQRCRTEERKPSPSASTATSTRTRRALTPSGCSTGSRRRRPASRRASASAWRASGRPPARGPTTRPSPTGGSATTTSATWTTSTSTRRKPAPKAQFFFYSKDPRRRVQGAVAPRPERAERLDGDLQERLRRLRPAGQLRRVGAVNDGPPHEKSKFAGAQGRRLGARPQPVPARTTYSHEPEFTYYFVGFRCCRDVGGAGAAREVGPLARSGAGPVGRTARFRARSRRAGRPSRSVQDEVRSDWTPRVAGEGGRRPSW